MEKKFTLTIEKLAGLGDGVGTHAGKRIFVPCTLPGDVARVRVVSDAKEAVHAALEEIIVPGEGRAAPVCRHFANCGGCTLQHLSENTYRDFKQTMAREAVRKAGYDTGTVAPLVRVKPRSRRRADLKVEYGRLGYYAWHSHRLVDITQCPVLEAELEALILRLKPKLTAIPGLDGVHINGVDGGYDVLLHTATKVIPFEDRAAVRISAGQNDAFHVLSQRAPVTVTFGRVAVEPSPGAFFQASLEAQHIMTQFVLAAASGAKRVLDLFAGLGTYAFALTEQARVTAVEGDLRMAKAMQNAGRDAGLAGFTAVARDLFRRALTPGELAAYDMAVINPPRAGAKAQITELAASRINKVAMISCNPATFSRDAGILRQGGYRLLQVVPLDQFIYSPHLEILAEFVK